MGIIFPPTAIAINYKNGSFPAVKTVQQGLDLALQQIAADKWKSNIPLTGTIDGVNKTFTIPDTIVAGSQIVFLGLPLFPTVGYTISGSTVTFTNAPEPGDYPFACYLQA